MLAAELANRMLIKMEVGAHAKPYNRCSIGICYEGGRDEQGRFRDTRTPKQKERMGVVFNGCWVFRDAKCGIPCLPSQLRELNANPTTSVYLTALTVLRLTSSNRKHRTMKTQVRSEKPLLPRKRR